MSEQLRTYSELVKRTALLSRFNYLALRGEVGATTFGFERQFNQDFYSSIEWKRVRDIVIVRDDGCDLGIPGEFILNQIHIHHMNPLTREDIRTRNQDRLFNPEYLICVSPRTHNAIHYGDETQLPAPFIERRPGDHVAWRKE